MRGVCRVANGWEIERLVGRALCLALAREGRATRLGKEPPAGVFGERAIAGALPCEGAG